MTVSDAGMKQKDVKMSEFFFEDFQNKVTGKLLESLIHNKPVWKLWKYFNPKQNMTQ